MKKISYLALILFLFFGSIICVNAANKLMQCEYNANYLSEDYYIKYRITYYDDKSIVKEVSKTMDGSYTQSNNRSHQNVTIFKSSDNNAFSSIPQLGDSFNASVMEKYYEKKICPYLAFYVEGTTAYFTPVEDTSIHDPINNHIWVSEGTTNIFAQGGNPVVTPEIKVTTTCAVHTTSVSIKNVPAMTAVFSMYNDGKKTFKMYLTQKGESYAQEMTIKSNEDTSARLSGDNGNLYIIQISKEELSNIFKQNAAQFNNNVFTCPNSLYLYEESYSEGYYRLTTKEEEANEWNQKTETEEGTGDPNEKNPSGLNFNEVKDVVLCDTPRILKAFQIVGYILFAVKIVIPLILIILATIDFAKAVTSSDDKADKEVLRKLINRVILAIVIFLIPTVLDVGFSLVDGATETTNKFSKCSSCLFDPYNSCNQAGLGNTSSTGGTSITITGECTCVSGNNPNKSKTFSCADKNLKNKAACDSFCDTYYRGAGGFASTNTCQSN